MKLRYPTVVKRGKDRISPAGRIFWCGPFAVAVLLGWEYDHAYEICLEDQRRASRAQLQAEGLRGWSPTKQDIAEHLSTVDVKATYPHQVGRVIRRYGVPCEFVVAKTELGAEPTVLTFVRQWAEPGVAYLIHASQHWFIVKDGVMYHSQHDPMPVESMPHYRRSKVFAWAAFR